MIEPYAKINLNNGFANYGFGFEDASYEYRLDGYTVVQGLVRVNKPVTNNEVLGQFEYLYSGHAPTNGTLRFPVVSEKGVIAVDITPTGQIIVRGEAGGWISLSGIVFNTHAKG